MTLLQSAFSVCVSMVATLIFCLPFSVFVHRIIVCWINELKSIAGHTTSETLRHKTFFTFGSFESVRRNFTLLPRLATSLSLSMDEFTAPARCVSWSSTLITESLWPSFPSPFSFTVASFLVFLLACSEICSSVGFVTISILCESRTPERWSLIELLTFSSDKRRFRCADDDDEFCVIELWLLWFCVGDCNSSDVSSMVWFVGFFIESGICIYGSATLSASVKITSSSATEFEQFEGPCVLVVLWAWWGANC